MQPQQKYNDDDGDESNNAQMPICWQCGRDAQKLSGGDQRDVKNLSLADQLSCQIFDFNLFQQHCCMGGENVCQ